jgi:DNA invertase Pin-like site-specific DNA recombinase
MTRSEVRERIAQYLIDHPGESYKSIAKKLNIGLSTIGNIAREYNIRRYAPRLTDADLAKLEQE